MNIETIRENWELRGYNFFLWHDPPGKDWPGIIHPVEEVVMLLDGHLTFGFPDGMKKLERNKEITVKPNCLHTVHNPGCTPNRWCYGYKIVCKQE